MAMDPETVAAALAQMIRNAGAAAGAGGRRPGLPRISERDFRRVDTFAGELGTWRAWSHRFRMALRSVNEEAYMALDWVQRQPEEVDHDAVGLAATGPGPDFSAISHEIYPVLVLLTRGEPGLIVESTTDSFTAWWRLTKRYAPSTPALKLVEIQAVLTPTPAKNPENVREVIEKWEARTRALREVHDEQLGVGVRVAVLLSIVPVAVRDAIYDSAARAVTYEEARDLVCASADNRAAWNRTKPTPMEVGNLTENARRENEEVEELALVDVDTATCANCGGIGHFRRSCPSKPQRSSKGKGKKGASDGGKSAGGKGAGKETSGFKGKCFKCKKIGHRAMDCTATEYATDEVEESQPHGGGGEIHAVWDVMTLRGGQSTASEETEIIVDSGAARSVAPVGWSNAAVEREPDARDFRTANGSVLKNRGKQRVVLEGSSLKGKCAMKFFVTDVQRPLASVRDLCSKGNTVTFRQGTGQIRNERTGRTIDLYEKEGTYRMRARLVPDFGRQAGRP